MKVKIRECSGLSSGKVGRVVSWNQVKTNGRGIPTNCRGEYNPLTRQRKQRMEPVRLNDGKLILMFKNRLIKI